MTEGKKRLCELPEYKDDMEKVSSGKLSDDEIFEIAQYWEARSWVEYLSKTTSRQAYLRHRVKGLRETLRILGVPDARGDILDLGCGPISVWESYPDSVVLAVDPILIRLSQMTDLCRVGQSGNTFYQCGELKDVEHDQFDFVYTENAIDHCPDWKSIVLDFPRVMKWDMCQLIFGVTIDEREERPLRRRVMHPCGITWAELRAAFDEAGLRILKEHETRRGRKVYARLLAELE